MEQLIIHQWKFKMFITQPLINGTYHQKNKVNKEINVGEIFVVDGHVTVAGLVAVIIENA